MKLSTLTKAELIARLNHAERLTLRAQATRVKREALLLGRDLVSAVKGTYRLGQDCRNWYEAQRLRQFPLFF